MPMLSQTLEGKLTLSGLLDPLCCKNLVGSIDMKGELTLTELVVVTINHSLSFVGLVSKRTHRAMASSVSFYSILNKLSTQRISRTLNVEGDATMIKNPALPKHSIINWFRRGHH